MENLFPENSQIYPEGDLSKHNFLKRKTTFFILGAILFIILWYFLFFTAPINFPKGKIVSIEQGVNLRSVSLKLKNERIIHSRIVFEAFAIIYGGERHIVASDYLLERKLPVFEIARRISRGESHLAPVKVVIPEGFNNSDIADNFALKLNNFDKSKFLLEAQDKEGYLFPDTYFFFTTANEVDAIKSLSDNFEKKMAVLRPEILSQNKSEKDIIIMASVIEKEAKGDDRGLISGILWKRFSIGMPLQADAAPETYKTKGLPQSPIGNPGLLSIKAAIHPVSSPYLYYLHDKDGNIYYAKNFEEHKSNKKKYLK
ncbi:hypothetical protein A2911_02175 [Candidatus Nomurabacteria bacterium RIFCSPLOWO2_01_FULL_40_15]|uniref:Endolytic murein transglycosylase n=1 Tax=Candidatus Nomurabacteria bacterium RIFCSPLOWO2_01_FULL_40_15 TaxID=1801772 RepID=A0A1F6X7Z5_9BACT|nr:MAG: hypothetical protein A2911_02175 [Candidatus Nomurabacteria bacterium RIFCSPLOWO2_01_FULL_40_15]